MTLYDRLAVSRNDATPEELVRMNNLAAAVYMTAEGIPFIMSGEEMLRSKPKGDGTFDSNSFSSGDEINSLKWSDLEDKQYQDVYQYYKGLIAFRKAHSCLRLSDAAEVEKTVKPVSGMPEHVVAFDIAADAVADETAEQMYLVFNADNNEQKIELPDGTWNVYINGEKAGMEVLETISDKTVKVSPVSAMVLVREDAAASGGWGMVLYGVIALVLAIGIVAVFTYVSGQKVKKAQDK